MNREQPRGSSWRIPGIIALILGVILAFAIFYTSNVRRITNENGNYIADVASQRAALMDNLFGENLAYIESAAIVLETQFDIDGVRAELLNVESEGDVDAGEVDKVANVLRMYERRFAFDHLRFIDLYGRDYTTGEKVIAAVVSERDYFKRGVQGETGMTYILDSKVTSERQIGFYSPVHQDGEIVGIVVGFYGESFIDRLLSTSLFEHDCDVLLCDRSGVVIYSTEEDLGVPRERAVRLQGRRPQDRGLGGLYRR